MLISTVDISEVNNAKESDNDATSETPGSDSRKELDSHAKMTVVGHNCYILSESGTFAEVNSFSLDYEKKKIPIVDAAVQYDYPHSMMTYILVIRNNLQINSMTNNMIPPFMMQESEIMVYDTPKI